jgi:glycosyltransferase involved in cell wall biosynthesis
MLLVAAQRGTRLNKNICVIIPAYNVADTIGDVVKGAYRFVSMVLVADDGSSDTTAENASKAGAAVIRVKRNKGKGNALKLLFEMAIQKGFEAVISMDGDGQHDPEEIPKFIKTNEKYPDRIIVGSRMHAKEHIPRARYNSMHVARFFISLAANQFVEDTQCGFRVYPLKLIQKMQLTQSGYVTESEILIKAGDMGAKIDFIRIGAIYGEIQSHFKPVLDVTAITAYIISYFALKYSIEGILPDRPDTYHRGNLRDIFAAHVFSDIFYKIVTVSAGIPLNMIHLLMYAAGARLNQNNFASVRRLGHGFHIITLASLLLPLLLVIIICEKLLAYISIEMKVIDGFIEKFYPHLW